MSDHRPGIVIALFSLLTACRQDMHDQPAYRPLMKSTFFTDARSARPVVEGTIARGHLRTDRAYFTGRTGEAPAKPGTQPATSQPAGQPVQRPAQPVNARRLAQPAQGKTETAGEVFAASYPPDLVKDFPYPVTREMVLRGRTRFEMFCVHCHGYTGYGNGMIVQRGLNPPPSYHIERLRNAPVGHFFDVMTNGYGAMYSYAQRVSVDDRWAIAAYIRALQASQAGTVADVPADQKTALEQAPQQEATPPPGEMRPGAPPTPEGRPQGGSPENK
jgi:mono/diheme cytochrome c family protein